MAIGNCQWAGRMGDGVPGWIPVKIRWLRGWEVDGARGEGGKYRLVYIMGYAYRAGLVPSMRAQCEFEGSVSPPLRVWEWERRRERGGASAGL